MGEYVVCSNCRSVLVDVDFEKHKKFTCRVAEDLKSAKELIEAGFEFVTNMDDKKLFRKRK